MKIVWSPLAIDRIREVATYIARDDLSAAQRWIELIFEKVENIRDFPELGRIVPELNRKEIRELLFKNYRIIYRLDKNRISTLTIRHMKQILPEKDLGQ